MTPRQAVSLAALTVLCGCALIDQNTFGPPPAPPAPKVAAAPVPFSLADKRVPLLTIGFATPHPDYQKQLHYVVQQAQARRPNVVFDVVSAVPPVPNAASDILAAGRGDAMQVMRAMMSFGVPDARIHLGTRLQPGLAAPQVLVYVR